MFSFHLLMGKLTFFFLSSLLLLHPEARQADLPIPIDPKEIFTSSNAVKIVETLPLYVADQKQVSFYNYEKQQWFTYLYPKFPLAQREIPTAYFTENPDGSYMLKVDYYIPCTDNCEVAGGEGDIDFTPPRAAFTRERWHFELTTGQFTPFETICGDYARAIKGEGEWVVATSNSKLYLCNTETGQSSKPLPAIEGVSAPAILRYPALSADGHKLAFTFYYLTSVWVYDFQQNKLIPLGSMSTSAIFTPLDYPVIDWIDNERIVIEGATNNYGGDEYYLYAADASVEDNLELFYHRFVPYLSKLTNPTRFMWIGDSLEAESPEATPDQTQECTFHEFNPLTKKDMAYQIADVCSQGLIITDGSNDRLTLNYPHESNTPQSIIRFNRKTGFHQEIPVENLLGLGEVSPDGHYVVVSIDQGQQDFQVAVLDLQTNMRLKPFYPTPKQYNYVEWIGNHTFRQSLGEPNSTNLYSISNSGVSVQSGDFSYASGGASPDKRFLLYASNHGTIDILNIDTFQSMTIAQIPNGITIGAVWGSDGLINISASQGDYDAKTLGRWRVKFNG
ncbi:MAG: WD40 repeat domain-containing protein [Anaerolineae bacterium]|nr:WD40 repeat domain-containing protein [Anaerolineae bacterium]